MDLQGLVNISQYPVEDPTSSDFSKLVARCRETFVSDGIVTLPNFFTKEAVDAVVSEVEAAKGSAWFTDTEHNVFLDSGDELFPQEHVRNRQLPTTVASLAYDCLDQKSPLLRLYHTESFTKFIGDVLGLPKLYRLADPLGAASINIFRPGTGHNWHFDESAFSVTLMLQTAEQGGDFRLTRPIREKGDECGGERESLFSNLEAVMARKEPGLSRSLTFEPATLSIFSGSRCLHEVTKVDGERDRFVAVFCFSTKAGVKNSAKVQEMFWGRVVY